MPSGGEPDCAAIIAALEACTGRRVEAVVGKPSRYMIDAALRLLDLPAAECLMTGDRLETDVLMGQGDQFLVKAAGGDGATDDPLSAGASILR